MCVVECIDFWSRLRSLSTKTSQTTWVDERGRGLVDAGGGPAVICSQAKQSQRKGGEREGEGEKGGGGRGVERERERGVG